MGMDAGEISKQDRGEDRGLMHPPVHGHSTHKKQRTSVSEANSSIGRIGFHPIARFALV